MSSAREPITRRYRAHPGWHVLGAGLVGSWLAIMAVMFWPAERVEAALTLGPEALARALADDETWMAAYHKDRKMGYVHSRIERSDERTILLQESRLKVSVAGLAQKIDSDMKVVLGATQRLESLDFRMEAGPLSIRVEGRVVPEGLVLQIDIGGQPGQRVLPLDEAPVFDLALPYLLARRDLQPGDRFRVSVFDPQSLSNQESVVEVIGPEAVQDEYGQLVPALHLRRHSAGLALDSWLGPRGQVYKEQLEGGLILLRVSRERATQDVDEVPTIDLTSPDADWLRGLVGPPSGQGAQP